MDATSNRVSLDDGHRKGSEPVTSSLYRLNLLTLVMLDLAAEQEKGRERGLEKPAWPTRPERKTEPKRLQRRGPDLAQLPLAGRARRSPGDTV